MFSSVKRQNNKDYSDEQICSTADDLRNRVSKPEDIPSSLRIVLAQRYRDLVEAGLVLPPDANGDEVE
jgi:hypothetical protein